MYFRVCSLILTFTTVTRSVALLVLLTVYSAVYSREHERVALSRRCGAIARFPGVTSQHGIPKSSMSFLKLPSIVPANSDSTSELLINKTSMS